MNKIDHNKVNRSNAEIWALMANAIKTKNIALVESNLHRLYKLQKHYIDLLFYLESENLSLKTHLADCQKTCDEFERDWINLILKDPNGFEKIKEKY